MNCISNHTVDHAGLVIFGIVFLVCVTFILTTLIRKVR